MSPIQWGADYIGDLRRENAKLRALILVMDGWVEGGVFWGSIQGKAFTPQQADLWASITKAKS